jgi:hypothetical protein
MPTYEQNTSAEVFPDGVYNFKVVDACEKESAQTHNPFLELQVDVLNDDFTAKVRVIERLVFTPNAYHRIDAFRRATGEKITTGGKVSFEAEDCIDRRGRCQLKTTTYNGRNRNEIDFYIESTDGDRNGAPAQHATSKPVATKPVAEEPF